MTAFEEERQLSELVARLAAKFPHLAVRVIDEEVHGIHRDFDGHRVREFILLLVERIAERQLSRRVSYHSNSNVFDPLWNQVQSPHPMQAELAAVPARVNPFRVV